MGERKNFTIGVLGGMGTYATINMFRQYADIFEAEKEWDRPRIIIDNRCTMPSRVRAIMYNENIELLVDEMIDSLQSLVTMGGENIRIILACNTSHIFLPLIYKKVPTLKKYIVNIVDECIYKIQKDNISNIYLLASEGTIKSRVYTDILKKNNINCNSPSEEEFYILRECIEAVKQNKYSNDVLDKFSGLLNRHNNCILGCTELPILFDMCKDKTKTNIYDPLLIALKKIKKEFDNYE